VKPSRVVALLLVVFVLSGFAGLIYQSIWSHYLGLVLGHAAYAQTLVLSMFMGGMALGAWLISRRGAQQRRLLLGYGVVEIAIGVAGLVFHPLFLGYLSLSQEQIIPALQLPGLVTIWQWLSAAVLIAPQTVLLGATFPLMVQGVLRLVPAQDGEVLGGMYFANGLGAAAGVLAATFLLLPAVGMPGAMAVAGSLNVLVGIVACVLSLQLREATWVLMPGDAAAPPAQPAPPAARQTEEADESVPLPTLAKVVLGATFASSAASFVYEIGWVRLLNQALGSTLHSFELMLAAFIAGMALGGLWVRRHAGRIRRPLRYVGYVQVCMGLAALLSVPLLAQSFDWVGWLMQALGRTEQGYTLYSIGTAVIAVLIMVPAAFFAGMTLPVFTVALLRQGAGESAIGRVYAFNTLGAIVGVLGAVHVLIPLFGVSLSITLAATLDALIGLYLLRFVAVGPTLGVAISGLATAGMVAVALLLGRPEPAAQASGVFRTGQSRISGEVIYLKDGKTSTITASMQGDVAIIATNGKPDASLRRLQHSPTEDEITMIMAGLLAVAAPENPEQIGIIGWGSGLSTHTVLGSPLPKRVETIEIERAMWEGAKVFGPRVARAYEDPRSVVYFDDARTHFAAGRAQYDAILSEPSNPWVSGVASLFTREFYQFAHRHLREGGALVQWLQTYELSDPVLAEMVAALLELFPDVDVYSANSGDLLIVARRGERRPLNGQVLDAPVLREELRRVGLGGLNDLEARRIGGAAVLRALVRLTGARPHTDFHPTVALKAPRDRFMQRQARLLYDLVRGGYPVLRVLECREPLPLKSVRLPDPFDSVATTSDMAIEVFRAFGAGQPTEMLRRQEPGLAAAMRQVIAVAAHGAPADAGLREALAQLATATLGGLPDAQLRAVWDVRAWWRSEQPPAPEIVEQLSIYAAFARRDYPVAAELAASRLDRLEAGDAPTLREQFLLLGVLAELAQGKTGVARQWEDRYAKSPMAGALSGVRSFLLAWDGYEPVCAAKADAAPTPTDSASGANGMAVD
jgi:predicted membrane-bound spermidine synthase